LPNRRREFVDQRRRERSAQARRARNLELAVKRTHGRSSDRDAQFAAGKLCIASRNREQSSFAAVTHIDCSAVRDVATDRARSQQRSAADGCSSAAGQRSVDRRSSSGLLVASAAVDRECAARGHGHCAGISEAGAGSEASIVGDRQALRIGGEIGQVIGRTGLNRAAIKRQRGRIRRHVRCAGEIEIPGQDVSSCAERRAANLRQLGSGETVAGIDS